MPVNEMNGPVIQRGGNASVVIAANLALASDSAHTLIVEPGAGLSVLLPGVAGNTDNPAVDGDIFEIAHSGGNANALTIVTGGVNGSLAGAVAPEVATYIYMAADGFWTELKKGTRS